MQFIAYILIYPFLWIVSILPFRILYIISDGAYLLAYYILGYRKKIVKKNLLLVFPEKSEIERKQIMKGFYHHFCDMIFESIKSLTISEKQINKRFVFNNLEEIRKFEDANQSIILMCGHYGSWEWVMTLQRHLNFKGYGVYKRLRNAYFDKLVKRVRGKYNSYLITTKEAIPTLINLKKQGELFLCGMAADQSPKLRKAYHWKNFMGVKVPIHTGSEMISKKLNLPVVFLRVNKVKRGYYEANFETIADDPSTFKDYQITDKFMELVEEQIHEDAQFYLWSHNRWKHKDSVPENFQ
jgi:KDO2-lipid IV(A) lauroyltransferase